MSAPAEQVDLTLLQLNDIRRVFGIQQQRAIALRTSTAAQRIAKLRKLIEVVENHREEIYAAGFADFKKPQTEVELTEVMPILAEAKHAIRKVKKWMKPSKVMPTTLMYGTKAEVRYEPKGVTLIVAPWNYPLNLSFSPLVCALAAGCTAVIKPSEMTPHMATLMTKMVQETFTEDEVAIFEGDARTSQMLLDQPFNHIFFTGSPAIGKIVMGAAAKHLASVTLELGGKSPTIIHADADIAHAARNVMWGKFTNNGQTCIAPDHVYVHDSIHDQFVAACADVLKEVFGADAAAQQASPDYCRIVNRQHYERIAGILEDATATGAKLACGGATNADDCFIAPTLVTDVDTSSRIMQEEIFGPLLPIMKFTDLDKVIADINAGEKPLALYVYGKDKGPIEQVLTQTSAGGSCINHCVLQYAHGNLPFGGVNNSGIGNTHGLYGFKAFSHERAILKNQVNVAQMLYPPYTDKTNKLISLMARFL